MILSKAGSEFGFGALGRMNDSSTIFAEIYHGKRQISNPISEIFHVLPRGRGRAIPGAEVEKSELRGILSATGSWKASIFEKRIGRPIEVEDQELFAKIQGEANK